MKHQTLKELFEEILEMQDRVWSKLQEVKQLLDAYDKGKTDGEDDQENHH